MPSPCRSLPLAELQVPSDNQIMRLYNHWFAGALLLLVLAALCRADDRKPAWRVDLRQLPSRNPEEITIRFSGPYLVVYAGSLVYPGTETGWVRIPSLVFDSRSVQVLAEQTISQLTLPQWDECPRTRFRKMYPAVNLIDCRKSMSLEQIGGIGPGVTEPAEFYLQEPGKEKVLIFRARKRCQPGDPRFISDALILLRPCNNNVVVDKKGQKVYDMPSLTYYYVTVNRNGTRFAVYERDISFFNQFGGTDRLRVKVFRPSNGEKLFDYRWHPADELTNDGRIALSDDGSLLAIVRGNEVLIFRLPD